MNELLEILNEIDDTIDYKTETGLITTICWILLRLSPW